MTHLDDDDLRTLIDGSFGDGPPAPSLAVAVAAGRRAVRRRRATALGSVLAVAVTLAGGGLVVRDLAGTDRAGGAPAAPVTLSPSGVRYPVVEAPASSFPPGTGLVQVVAHEPRLEVRAGTEVLAQVDDPYGPDATWSAALLVRAGGRTGAYLARWDPDGSSSVDGSDPDLDVPFADWVAGEVALQRESFASDPLAAALFGGDLIGMDAEGEVRPIDGVKLVEVVPDPYGRDAGPEVSAAVALRYEGRERWAVIRRHGPGGASTQYAVFADEATAASFTAFVDHQERRLYPDRGPR